MYPRRRIRNLSNVRNKGLLFATSRPPSTEADVSIPGLTKLFVPGYPFLGKVIWGLAITACFVVCAIQIWNRVATFLEVPLEVKIDVVRNQTIEFPAVLICPLIPMAYSMNFYALRMQYAAYFNLTYTNYSNLRSQIRDAHLLNMPNFDAVKLYDAARINSVHVQAVWGYKPSTCSKVLSEDVPTYYAMCTTHSLEKDIRFNGAQNGYEIILKDYENYKDSPLKWTATILLHEKGDIPLHKVFIESGQALYPNYETVLTFNVKQYRRFNTPSSPCRSRAEVRNCTDLCIDENIMATGVSCRHPYMKRSHLPICTVPTDAFFTENATKQIYNKWKHNKICGHCPRKCVENIYTLSQNVIGPTGGNFTHLKVLLLTNVVDVVIEFPSFTSNVLLSDIGGYLGLFLGVCILTGLQILEIIIIKIYNMVVMRM